MRRGRSPPRWRPATKRPRAAAGKIPRDLAATDRPLDFLVREGGAESVIDAAYRYARHEPGVDTALFGAGEAAHVEANAASILRPPLPAADRARLAEWFGALEGAGSAAVPGGPLTGGKTPGEHGGGGDRDGGGVRDSRIRLDIRRAGSPLRCVVAPGNPYAEPATSIAREVRARPPLRHHIRNTPLPVVWVSNRR